MMERRTKPAPVRDLRVILPLLILCPVASAADRSTAPAAAPTPAPAAASLTAQPAAVSDLPQLEAPGVAMTQAVAPDEVTSSPAVSASAAEPEPAAFGPAAPADASPAAVDAAPADAVVAPSATDLPAFAAPVPTPIPDLASAPAVAAGPLDPAALLALAQTDAAALGPLSIGTPDAGLLVNPRPMPEGSQWTIRNPFETWGTQETIDFVAAAITSVNERFPDTPRVVIGDMSRPDGGRLNRHKSHQVGRDVDVGFYYHAGEAGEFRQVRPGQIDLPRTWALVRAFLTDTDVDRIFVDRTVIATLFRYAREEEGEDVGWLNDVFGRGERKGIIQHERRHKDHLHVRFFNGVAQEKGRIVYPVLVEAGVVGPPMVKHVARRGETIGHIASRYGSSVSAIKAANGLRGTQIRAGRAYLVPVRRVRADGVPIVVPARRLPPSVSTQAAVPSEPAAGSVAPALAADGRN
jgi:murein endopeptidase